MTSSCFALWVQIRILYRALPYSAPQSISSKVRYEASWSMDPSISSSLVHYLTLSYGINHSLGLEPAIAF